MTDDAIVRLRRVAAAMRAGKVIQDDDALFLARGIEAAVSGKADLDVAFGLVAPSPLSREARVRRAVLIRKLDRQYGGSASARAKLIATDARQYAAACWPRHRLAANAPREHLGKSEEIFFELHRDSDSGWARWPLSWRSILESLQSEPLAAANNSAAQEGMFLVEKEKVDETEAG